MLGFTFKGQYFVDKMVPMGLKIACKCWKCFREVLELVNLPENIDHYLDDCSLLVMSSSIQTLAKLL